MEHLGVHENSLKRVHAFQIAVPREKPFGARERTNNKLDPHMLLTPGFQPAPQWWKESALTTASPLLSQNKLCN